MARPVRDARAGPAGGASGAAGWAQNGYLFGGLSGIEGFQNGFGIDFEAEFAEARFAAGFRQGVQ